MRRRWAQLCGWASLVGGVLAVLVNVPSNWYGLMAHDSYIFDPPVGSPLWISRVVIPILSIGALLGLLLGIGGLVRRDWPAAGRDRRWGGSGGVLAFGALTIAVPALLFSFQTADGILLTFVALAAGAVGLLALVPSVILLAYGYVQTDRPHIGYAFALFLLTVPVLGVLVPGPVQSLVAAVPIALAWGLFGVDLLQHPNPLSRSETEQASDTDSQQGE